MSNRTINTLILAAITLVLCGFGLYTTAVYQPSRMQQIRDMEKAARLQKVRVEQLLVEEATSEKAADEAVRKWRARYKYVPGRLDTPDIVQYLESLTREGFKGFNLSLVGVTTRPDYKYYTFNVDGTAYYGALYNFIWLIENNREFARVRDLTLQYQAVTDENPRTERQRRLDMVQFTMQLDIYFAGTEGLSAGKDSLAAIPAVLLPARNLPHNSFLPLVRTDLPPNDRNLLDFETAALVSILGGKAVFEEGKGGTQRVLAPGDEVYLGKITLVDPINMLVTAELNKGGLVQQVTKKMDLGNATDQARGKVRLRPIDRQ